MQLVTLDLDGTLLRSTVFQVVGQALGHGDRIAFVDDLYERGLISLPAAFYAEYPLFLGVPVEEAHAALERQGDWLDDIATTVARLREDLDVEVWVLTDQPDWATSYLETFGITDGIDTRTTRWAEDTIGAAVDIAFDERARLQQRLQAEGIDPAAVAHVGNGANDVRVFDFVGQSVAFNPSSPEVAPAADTLVESDSLAPILEALEGSATPPRITTE